MISILNSHHYIWSISEFRVAYSPKRIDFIFGEGDAHPADLVSNKYFLIVNVQEKKPQRNQSRGISQQKTQTTAKEERLSNRWVSKKNAKSVRSRKGGSKTGDTLQMIFYIIEFVNFLINYSWLFI